MDSSSTTRIARVLLAAGVVAALGGCALLEGPTPETPPRETPAVPAAPPEFFPEGSASDNLPYFTETVRAFAAGDQPVTGEPIVNAIADAGFDRGAMQVSFDETKTGLAADSIFVSVRIGEDCLIGQLVTADRSFVAEVQPVVGPNADLCLIGNTRPITW